MIEVDRRILPEIVLRVTPQSQMRLSVGAVALDLKEIVGPPNGSIRASVEWGKHT